MTQEDFFGFLSRPFQAAPQEGLFVPLEPMSNAVEQLAAAARKGDGVGVLTAVPGAGKSVVCCELKSQLSGEFLTVLLPSSTYPTRRSLLQAILYELGEDFSGLTEQEARLKLLKVAQVAMPDRAGVLLIVDEAHQLSPRLLEELRCLTNHVEDGLPLVRIILSGQLALEERLTLPELQALNYRITCHTTLEPLTMHESAEFINGRLAHEGRSAKTLFSNKALEIICRVSDGSPRCLNQIADACLSHAAESEIIPITDDVVRTVLQTLKQLPLQWNESVCDQLLNDAANGSSTTEFADDDGFDDQFNGEDFEQASSLVQIASTEDEMSPPQDEPPAEPSWMSKVTSIEVGADSLQPSGDCQHMSQTAETIEERGVEMQDQELQLSSVIEVGAEPETDDSTNALSAPPPETSQEADCIVDGGLQELPVVDPYAALDRRCEGQSLEMPHQDPSLSVDWKECEKTHIVASPHDESPNSIPTAEDPISQALAEIEAIPTESRIGRMIKALSDVVANELSRDVAHQRRESNSSEVLDAPATVGPLADSYEQKASSAGGPTVSWRATPDPMAFDIIEPEAQNDSPAIQDFVEEATNEILPWNGTDQTIDGPIPQAEAEPTSEHEGVTNSVEDAHFSVERPYARLFSRARKNRTPA